MKINNLAPSNITQAKPAASVAVAEPPKPVPSVKPPVSKTSVAKTPAAPKDETKVAEAVKSTEGTKTEITDVKPTGDTNAEGDPTFMLKINGKEYKATQSEIIALAQKAKAGEQALKEKAEIEKLTADLLDNFDKDTYGLLVRRHGKEKAKEIAVAMVRNLISQEEKTPEQIELEELRAEKARAKEAEEVAKKQKEEEERRQKQRTLYIQLLQEIDKELKETHLPIDKLTLTRVLNYLAAVKKANGQSWTVKDAVKAVEMEDMGHASYYAKRYVEGKLPSDKFREIFGEETVKKLNKEQINLLKNADKLAKHSAPLETSATNEEAPRRTRSLSKTKGSEGMSEREWRRTHGSLGGI